MKPVLISIISDGALEVLTDYQTTVVKAMVGQDQLCVSRGSQRANSEDGLIGALWSIDGVPSGTLRLTVRHYRGEGGEYEYLFSV